MQGPNHQFTAPLNAEQLGEWLKALPCDWLPRIGRTNRVKLESLRARSLRDVQHVSLEELRRVFGVNEGLRLYEACRGIDRTQNAFEVRCCSLIGPFTPHVTHCNSLAE